MNVKLRPWRETDLDALVRYAGNPKISANLTDAFPHPYSREDGQRFIAMATSHNPVRIFAIEADGGFVGGIGVHPQQDVYRANAELGYWVAEPFWGRGIATSAIRQIIPVAFSLEGIRRLYARPFGSNVASQRVLEKCGFVLEARLRETFLKRGEFLDELIYAVRA